MKNIKKALKKTAKKINKVRNPSYFVLLLFLIANSRLGIKLLHLAAKWNFQKVLEFLIGVRANVNSRDRKGSTAMHFAAKRGYTDIVRTLIVNGASVNAVILIATLLYILLPLINTKGLSRFYYRMMHI